MIIHSISVKNAGVNLKDLNFNFPSAGIYRISGPNGSGKTTLIEKIVFESYQVSFEASEETNIWLHNRSALFTYVPQNIISLPVRVSDYLDLGEPKHDEMLRLFTLFQLDESILSERFNNLSGGEKRKISIIRGLCRKTKYLFIDEPTNDLDNTSVTQLNQILSEHSKEHIIVLVSHDERLNLDFIADYHLSGDTLVYHDADVTAPTHNSDETSRRHNVTAKTIRLLKNFATIVTVCMAALVLSGIFLYNEVFWSDELSDEEPPVPNAVFVHGSYEHDGVLDRYLQSERIEFDESISEKYITWLDMPQIAEIDGVKVVYCTDTSYTDYIKKCLYEGTIGDEPHFVSIPEIIGKSFYYNSGIDIGLDMIDGAYPQDGKHEVVLSARLLCDHFGYTESQVSNAIGDSISLDINGTVEKYTVVGFTYFDYYIISFDESHQFGMYTYQKETYDDFAYSQILFEQERDGNYAMVHEFMVITEDGGEREVLNQIVRNYPAELVYSNFYTTVFLKDQFKDASLKLAVINIIISAILAVVFVFLNKSSALFNSIILWDCGNVMVSKRKPVVIYRLTLALIYIFITGVILALAALLSEHSLYSCCLLLIDAALMFIPVMVINCIKRNRTK